MENFFSDIYVWGNFAEGCMWLVIASAFVVYRKRWMHSMYERNAKIASISFLLFGISDFVEMYHPGYMHEERWLLLWKGVCVLVFIWCLWQYYALRVGGTRSST